MRTTTTRFWSQGALLSLAGVLFLTAVLGAQDDLADEGKAAEHLVRVVRSSTKTKRGRRPSLLGDTDLRRASPRVRTLARALKRTRVTLDLDEQPVKEFIGTVRELSNLTILMSARARKELAKKPLTISFSVEKLSLESLLNHVSWQLKTYRFTLRDGVIFLVHDTEYRRRRVLRIYSVTDLLRRPRHFRAPSLALRSGTPGFRW